MNRAVERAAARAVTAATGRLAERVAVAMPEARVVREDDRVTVVGRGVIAALPWPAGLLR